jgi:hypothetical protein
MRAMGLSFSVMARVMRAIQFCNGAQADGKPDGPDMPGRDGGEK